MKIISIKQPIFWHDNVVEISFEKTKEIIHQLEEILIKIRNLNYNRNLIHS